jgi:hypothetical protein
MQSGYFCQLNEMKSLPMYEESGQLTGLAACMMVFD